MGDVERTLSRDVTVNWTLMCVKRWEAARGHGVGTRQEALEQQARGVVGAALRDTVGQIRINDESLFADLQQLDGMGQTLTGRVRLWRVAEARYFSSGRVEIRGELCLKDVLKPWLLQHAQKPPEHPAATSYTGVVLDARGLSFEMAVVPKILDDQGEVLYDGTLWSHAALSSLPVVYVSDAAAPQATRAGKAPLFIEVSQLKGSNFVLSASDADVFRRNFEGSLILGNATVVVVVDR